VEQLVSRRWAVRRWWDLVVMLAWRDIRIKYKQSVMGFLWAILMPTLVVGAGIAVQYGLAFYSASRLLPETSRRRGQVRALGVLRRLAALRHHQPDREHHAGHEDLSPREVFPIAAVLSQFADFCVAARRWQ